MLCKSAAAFRRRSAMESADNFPREGHLTSIGCAAPDFTLSAIAAISSGVWFRQRSSTATSFVGK